LTFLNLCTFVFEELAHLLVRDGFHLRQHALDVCLLRRLCLVLYDYQRHVSHSG